MHSCLSFERDRSHVFVVTLNIKLLQKGLAGLYQIPVLGHVGTESQSWDISTQYPVLQHQELHQPNWCLCRAQLQVKDSQWCEQCGGMRPCSS